MEALLPWLRSGASRIAVPKRELGNEVANSQNHRGDADHLANFLDAIRNANLDLPAGKIEDLT